MPSSMVFGLNDGDHVGIKYVTIGDISKIIINFTLRGMAKNQLNVWGINKDEKKQWIEILKTNGVDVQSMVNSEDLVILGDEEYNVDPKYYMNQLQSLKDLIKNKQKSGINIIDTSLGNLFSLGKFDHCIKIEKMLDEMIGTSEIPITMIHLYSSSMTKEQQSSIAEVHNSGLVLLTEKRHIINTKSKNELENEKIKIDGYQYQHSEVFQEKELAIFKSLSDMIVIYQEKQNFEKNEITPNNILQLGNDNWPKWYADMIQALDELFNAGYAFADKSNKELK